MMQYRKPRYTSIRKVPVIHDNYTSINGAMETFVIQVETGMNVVSEMTLQATSLRNVRHRLDDMGIHGKILKWEVK